MVYCLVWKKNSLPALPTDWQRFLPCERVEKALCCKQEKDRIASVYAFLLLRYALYCEFGLLNMPQLETDANGKPYAVNGNYQFNLSHCDLAVACAVGKDSVGVDVQDFRSVRETVVRKVCSETEIELLRKSQSPERLFAAFWASKEAFGKWAGHGIDYDLSGFSLCGGDSFPSVCRMSDVSVRTDLTEDFALSVCAASELPCKYISCEQLQTFLASL